MLLIYLFVNAQKFPLQEVPKGKWFCHPDCLRIHSALQKLVAHGEQKLPESLLNVVRKKHNEKGSANGALDIKWRVLSGKTSTDDESLQLLSKALAIFHVSKVIIFTLLRMLEPGAIANHSEFAFKNIVIC